MKGALPEPGTGAAEAVPAQNAGDLLARPPPRRHYLVTSHGWSAMGGVMTCEVPAKCGAGIAAGTPAKFALDFSTSPVILGQIADIYKSDASLAGIDISVVGESFNTIIGKDTQTNPNWTMSGYGGWVFNGPGFAPTGEPLFQTGAGSNSGSYSDPTMDSLITAAQTASGFTAFHNYANYAAAQLPYLFYPEQYFVQAEKTNLHGVAYNPYFTFLPEYWYFTK